MSFLKSYWFLILFIFSVGGYFTKLQMQVNKIDTKLDRNEYLHDKQRDSLKRVIEEKEKIIIQQKLKLPHGTINDSSEKGGN